MLKLTATEFFCDPADLFQSALLQRSLQLRYYLGHFIVVVVSGMQLTIA